jgi:6-phosphogluconate dehydrogenase
MKVGLGLENDAMSRIFRRWNKGVLDSYLIEITGDILAYRDEQGQAVVDLILDSAGQKGTGKWAAGNALDLGIPLTLIAEAVSSRFLSALKAQRVAAAEILTGPETTYAGDQEAFLADLEQALYAAKIISYAQGYMLMQAAATEYGWNLNYGGVALMWREGCIIRSAFLGDIERAYRTNPALDNLLLDTFFNDQVTAAAPAWRRVVATAATLGLPAPALSSALAFYDGYRRARLPANLIQAQRDYFGAHTYERIDRPRGEHFHTDWTGHGGDTTAESYQA